MQVSDFDFPLPEELIAQGPLPDRSASRLLHLQRTTQALSDRSFRDLPALLRPGDLVVLNDTRVFPARLYGHRSGTRALPISEHNPAAKDFLRGRIEVLLTRQRSMLEWEALVRPGRKIGVGEQLFFSAMPSGPHSPSASEAPLLSAEVIGRGGFGQRTLRFHLPNPSPDASTAFFDLLDRVGHVPLPPYISRPDEPSDRERYQTIHARHPGSVAAPTAGLHFTPEIMAALAARDIHTATITLHVGLGTFQPVRVERVEDHQLHSESFTITPAAAGAIHSARRDRRRIVAVGTTTTRTLEACAAVSPDGDIQPQSGETGLFIYPGHRFRVVDALLTNFHLPRSSLLMLVSAFAGREFVLRAYAHAVAQRYRFFSYGDCMLIE